MSSIYNLNDNITVNVKDIALIERGNIYNALIDVTTSFVINIYLKKSNTITIRYDDEKKRNKNFENLKRFYMQHGE